MSDTAKLRNTIKYPTSIIVGGADVFGVELAKSLLDQGGFVIIIDYVSDYTKSILNALGDYKLFSFFDFSEIQSLDDNLRRLDYVFYLSHRGEDLDSEISSQEFLEFSKYLDRVLSIANNYESKFLASTSIKAHQYLLEKKQLDHNFESSTELHTVYIQSEIQRYTESLTKEYIEKTGLDARIVRLGELIGEGVEYLPNSVFGRLVNEAISEDMLTIYGDGLDAEYYVHIQDAVYGIIKAQFSKNTRGEIFSVAYEHETTVLSIAYKLNEFCNPPKEIRFANEEIENNIPIRLYKPAPNLLRIGWKPRITFERALKQTYDYIAKYTYKKAQIIESELSESQEVITSEGHKKADNTAKKKSGGFRGFLKWIFLVSDNDGLNQVEEESHVQPIDEQGALGRLIAERRAQEKGRKGSILLANKYVQEKEKSKANLSPFGKLNSALTKSFDRFMGRFDAFRYITIRQFIFGMIVIIVTFFFYFNIISLILASLGNIVVAYKYSQDINIDMSNKNYENIGRYLVLIDDNLEKVKGRVEIYDQYLSGYEQYDQFSNGITQLYSGVSLVNEGFNDIYTGIDGVTDYIGQFEENILYRPSTNSLLVIDNTKDYSASLKLIDTQIGIVPDGLTKLDLGMQKLRSIDLKKINNNTGLEYEKILNNIDSADQVYTTFGKIGYNLPVLVGLNKERNYIIILVDNTNPLPAGGRPIALFSISMLNGGVRDIKLNELSDDALDVTDIDQYLVDEINLVNSTTKEKANIKMSDLFYLQQGELYLSDLGRVYSKVGGKTIDGVAICNLNFLAELLDITTDQEEFNQIKFDKSNLVTNLSLLVNESENKDKYRKEILTNLFAISIQNIFKDFKSNIISFSEVIEKSVQNKDLVVSFYDSNLNFNGQYSDNITSQSPDYITILPISGQNVSDSKTLPSISVGIDVFVRKDFSSRKTVNIDYNGAKNLEAIVVCHPSGISNIVFSEEAEFEKIQRFNESRYCIRFTPEETNKVSYSYDTITQRNLSGDYDYTLGLRKNPGVSMNYDVKISVEDAEVVEFTEGGVQNTNNIQYIGSLGSDKIFGIDIK